MVEIIPAILPKSFEELESKLDIVATHSPLVQIDVCDGLYVPSRTWPYLKGEDTIFDSIVAEESAIPHWDEVDFEFDLMVKNAYEKIPDFISAGAKRIVVHKASTDATELESIIRDYGKQSDEIGPFDVALGLAIGSQANPEEIAEYIKGVHFVQVMGIQKIGFQGQSFDENSVRLVKALREAYPHLTISVDGGVNLETGTKLVLAGADRLVVGSALFASNDFLGTLESFQSL